VNNDKDYWGDPENFRPERFLDDEGNFRRDERLSAFGLGKRACLGRPLAEMELFLFVGAIFQKFDLSFAKGYDKEITPNVGFVFGCPDFKVIFKERNVNYKKMNK